MTKDDITRLELKLIEGIKTSDVKLLDPLLHDDLLFIAPNGQTVTKQADLAAHKAGGMRVDELKPTIENIVIIGDDAISVVVYDTKGAMMGAPVAGRFRYIRTWKQFDDGIRVIGGSCIQIS